MASAAYKERPMLYKPEMVRAILEDRKTQTRRVLKNADNYACLTGDCPHDRQRECDEYMSSQCPYGKVGDRLWVRETWSAKEVSVAGFDHNGPNIGYTLDQSSVVYRADGGEPHDRWRPSIHMPRWASRITLEIVRVWIERIQDISQADAKSEGIYPVLRDCYGDIDDEEYIDGAGGFRYLWDKINGSRGYSWSANPWVWAIEFKWER